jgi:hypothetical protein
VGGERIPGSRASRAVREPKRMPARPRPRPLPRPRDVGKPSSAAIVFKMYLLRQVRVRASRRQMAGSALMLMLLVLLAAGGAPSLPHSLPRLREAAARCAGPHVAHQRLGLRGGGKKQKRRAKSTRHVLEDLARTSLRTSAVRPRKAMGNEGVAGAVPPLKILRTGMLGHCFDPAPVPSRPFAASAPSYGRAAGEAARQRLRQEQETGRQWQQARVCKASDLSHSLPCLHPFTRVIYRWHPHIV